MKGDVKRKENFLQVYKETKCLRETYAKTDVSRYEYETWRNTDADFNILSGAISRQSWSKKRLPDEMIVERKKSFIEAYKKGIGFVEALKEAHISTHQFNDWKKSDKDFADEYAKISPKNITKVCEKCGRELPKSSFTGNHKFCNVCFEETKREKLYNGKNYENNESKKLLEQIKDVQKECDTYSLQLNVEKYIQASRRLYLLKMKYQRVREQPRNVYAESYSLPKN